MPREIIIPDEHYHVFNRGHNKQRIFFDKRDYARILFYILFFQSPIIIYNISEAVSVFLKESNFNLAEKIKKKIIDNRTVELEAFSLMPNHFHLKVHELVKGGLSKYLQRIEGGYTKYFNNKYKRSGYLFQGPFQSVHIKDNKQFLYLSAYLHNNPKELKAWSNKEHEYVWSSYCDYVGENRWDNFLRQDLILEQFSSKDEYRSFIKTVSEEDLLDIGRLVNIEGI